MRLVVVVVSIAAALVTLPQGPAKNVVLFLADAGGIPVINAASLHGYGAPRRLFVQRMPNIGLSDTTPTDSFVSDSASGMTAIVTGQKTKNGVISQSAEAQRKVADGAPLKTILEYAEERGMSTGIITNDAVTGATPATLYAKVNDRGMTSAIYQQIFMPRFGDGPDVIIGPGRAAIAKALIADKIDLDWFSKEKGRPALKTMDEIEANAARALVVTETSAFDLQRAIRTTLSILSRNPRGYFLMVEWDSHTDNVRRGLDRMVQLDQAIERTASSVGGDTLILFTADHSFDFRVRGGDPTQPLLAGLDQAEAQAQVEGRTDARTRAIRMENSHTGEEVLVAAQGPGANRVKGYLANTDLFGIMMDALGLKAN
jgi:alkaline phosphatase